MVFSQLGSVDSSTDASSVLLTLRGFFGSGGEWLTSIELYMFIAKKSADPVDMVVCSEDEDLDRDQATDHCSLHSVEKLLKVRVFLYEFPLAA